MFLLADGAWEEGRQIAFFVSQDMMATGHQQTGPGFDETPSCSGAFVTTPLRQLTSWPIDFQLTLKWLVISPRGSSGTRTRHFDPGPLSHMSAWLLWSQLDLLLTSSRWSLVREVEGCRLQSGAGATVGGEICSKLGPLSVKDCLQIYPSLCRRRASSSPYTRCRTQTLQTPWIRDKHGSTIFSERDERLLGVERRSSCSRDGFDITPDG
ncbi:unnamed protein product [Pleuronectes platessa]|uniref:Uncharacterized protein n=1 Tax=Pleuronectes platessa TaxID=8262 RepID=A0A9N7YCD2_PLEPL|nr:unnamed protein product [Pleuronectes platessa]